MATKSYTIWSFLILALMLSRGAMAQSGCSNNMISSLSSCIGYLRGNSSRPLPSCCASLASVQQAQPECICPLLSNNGASAALGIALNRTLAMAMPATCKLRAPQCDDDGDDGPIASSPAFSPSSPPSTYPTPTSDTDFDSDSKEIPNIDTSHGSAATMPIYLTLVAAWIAATCNFQN